MSKFAVSKFMYETIACGGSNQLSISSVCNARCVFCSNTMNPFVIHRPGFRDLEDIRRGICLLDPAAPEIRLGDSLPGRISEGEALLHPEIFKVLELIRKKAPNSVIQVNTNGTMLTRRFIENLLPYKPLKFSISYHSHNQSHWCRIFNLPKEKYKIARDAFEHLWTLGMLIEGVMVPLPGLVGYPDIENTIKTIRCFTKTMLMYAPGYSRKAPRELTRILDVDIFELSRFIRNMRKKYSINLIFPSDPLAPLDFYPRKIMMDTFTAGFADVLWLFSEAAYERADKILKENNEYVPNNHHGYCVKNRTYGGIIACSGLLLVQDYRRALREALQKFKDSKINLLLLPSNSFDRYGDDLRGENCLSLQDEFGIPFWLRTA